MNFYNANLAIFWSTYQIKTKANILLTERLPQRFNALSTALVIAICLLTSACSNRAMYEAVQENQRQECERIGHQSAREQCKEDYEKSYQEYEKEREQAIEE